MGRWVPLLLCLCCLLPHRLLAQQAGDENSDLNLIPKAIETKRVEPPPAEQHLSGRIFIEDVVTVSQNRELLVPPPTKSPSWQNRTSVDFDYGWQVNGKVRLSWSDRLNVMEGDTITFPSGENLRNDFREGYLTWETSPRTYLEAGRINLKNGIALGYNPTDFLKSRTTVDRASIDPSSLREDRLGSLMAMGQKIWDNGAVTLAFSPEVTTQSPLSADQNVSFDPLFGRTNGDNRLLASFRYTMADLNPQALLFVDPIGTHIGVNLSRVMTPSIVAYAEWSGVQESSLTDRAVTFGRQTGSLPPQLPLLPQTDSGTHFQNDLVLGASWTSSFDLTVNLEYHFHQAGFDAEDFNRWVTLGGTNSRLASEVWFIRQYAADQEEPLMQHEIFLRFDWQDILPSRLNAGLVMFISPYDGSVMAQASAQYFISRNWTVKLYLAKTIGGDDTVEGSLPWSTSGVLQIVRYF